MSVRSADTARERGRALNALLSYPGPASPPRWSRIRKRQSVDLENTYLSSGNYAHHPKRDESASYDDADDIAVMDDDALLRALDKPSSSVIDDKEVIDMSASTWKTVESMATMLAAGQSVMSTISKCYSLPSLRRTPAGQGTLGRPANNSPRIDTIQKSLISERLAAEALAIFRRLGRAPLSHPDSLYINSSKIPEAVKAFDPDLDDAMIRAWMAANGFEQGAPSKGVEALSWSEYRQALSEMCPAYRQYCMITCATDPASIHALDAMKRPGQYGHPPSSPPRSKPSLSGECCFDTWEDVVGRNDSVSIPPGRGDRRRGMEGGGPRVGDIPPRSPGADSFNILRRKRQAAVSVDYESITKELPQVMLPLDPSILVDHIKAHSRRERKNPTSDRADSSPWTLDVHDRLLKMTLQKAQVSETANPRPVQPRNAAVKIRSRRNDFCRRRQEEAGITSKLSRNVGVIGRHAKIADTKARARERSAAVHQLNDSERLAETRRSSLVKRGAQQRALGRRLKMEKLKSCIADQLRTIQENEAIALDKVRERRHVLQKGEGIDRLLSVKRVRSLSSFALNQVAGNIREPCTIPTVPPPDQDARWIYSSPKPLQLGSVFSARKLNLPPSTSVSSQFPSGPNQPAIAGVTLPLGATTESQGIGDADSGEGENREAFDVEIDDGLSLTTVDSGDPAAEEQEEGQLLSSGNFFDRVVGRPYSTTSAARPRKAKERPEPLRTGGTGEKVEGCGLSQSDLSRLLPRNAGCHSKENATAGLAVDIHVSERNLDGRALAPSSLWGEGLSMSPWARQVSSPGEWDGSASVNSGTG